LEQLRAVEQFAAADHSHTTELAEQQARLASIGLIPAEAADATCALCGQRLGEDPEPRDAVERALGRAGRRLELARRDTPRIDAARVALLERQRAARDEIRDVDQALNALAARDETVQRARDAVNVQSYVRGRIALYLDSSDDTGDEELERLRREVASAEQLLAPSRSRSTATPCDREPRRCCAPSAAR
jgi:DNA repair exonuclease SbcCD ATPase subunit